MQAEQQDLDHVNLSSRSWLQQSRQEMKPQVAFLRKDLTSLSKTEGYTQATSICSDLSADHMCIGAHVTM